MSRQSGRWDELNHIRGGTYGNVSFADTDDHLRDLGWFCHCAVVDDADQIAIEESGSSPMKLSAIYDGVYVPYACKVNRS
jgi:hypothetical protein